MRKLFIKILISLSLPLYIFSQSNERYAKKEFIFKNDTLRYNILYPKDYDQQQQYPVITFLHGSGERGNDNNLQLKNGGSFFSADSNKFKNNAIVIFPQCPNNASWRSFSAVQDANVPSGRVIKFDATKNPTTISFLVKKLLDSLQKQKIADRNRMYIGGLSLGGFGTFDFIERYPNYFAAAFPICGGGDTTFAEVIAKSKNSVWIFHGEKDFSVDVIYSRQYYNNLKKYNADVKYTEYPNVGHNSWDNVFQEKTLLEWVLSKKRK